LVTTWKKADEIYLKLAENFIINSALVKTVGTLENVMYPQEEETPILNSGRTGAVTNIGLRQLQQLPSITRSIIDFTRATPQASSRDGSMQEVITDRTILLSMALISITLLALVLTCLLVELPVSIDAIDEISVI
jgi:hypothetical protein